MTDSAAFVLAVAAGWAAIGLVLSVVMGRRGHNSFGWLVLGVLLGPLALVLAFEARRHDEMLAAAPVARRTQLARRTGPVDVLVGYDGSPESAAAPAAVADLLGDRLGRMTVATVVSFGGVRELERLAKDGLVALADRTPALELDLEVLHGRPAAALRTFAAEGGYDLVAVGTRGSGITKAILGSAAGELARDSKVPVLLVGDHGTGSGA